MTAFTQETHSGASLPARVAARLGNPRIAIPLLLIFGAFYCVAYFRLPWRWWFEDDPFLFAYAGSFSNPARFFTDPAVMRNFTTGRALVPMQLLSYWCDMKLAGASAGFAYAHQVASFLLTLVFLYLVLKSALPNGAIAALLISACWVLLPATAVVVQFLSTRHYLEGLLFSLLAIYIKRLSDRYSGRHWILQSAVWLCVVAAMLCKEIYVPVTPAIIAICSWHVRQRRVAVSMLATVFVYVLYRSSMIGPALDYGVPWLSAGQYPKFLSKLPYTISSNYGGYVLCAVLATLWFEIARREVAGHRAGWYFGAALVLCLAAILPVSSALYASVRTPGTWYRIVFLLHTIALAFGGYFAVRCLSRRQLISVALLTIAILIPGVEKTRQLWAGMISSAEREGKFYLANPDKVLLSEQAASWYIPGLDALYRIPVPHYVLLNKPEATQANQPPVVWRNRGGMFVPEPNPFIEQRVR